MCLRESPIILNQFAICLHYYIVGRLDEATFVPIGGSATDRSGSPTTRPTVLRSIPFRSWYMLTIAFTLHKPTRAADRSGCW